MECQLIFLLAYVLAVQGNPCLVRQKRAFPHEESCGKYLICKHGVPVEHDCPVDLHFDMETLNCRPRPLARCGLPTPRAEIYHVKRKPLPTVPPTPAIVTCKPPDATNSERTFTTPATTQSTATGDALSTTELPTTPSDVPPSTTVVPKTTSDVSPSVNEFLTISSELPSSTNEFPTTSSELQSSTTEFSTTSSDRPSITKELFTSTEIPTTDILKSTSEEPIAPSSSTTNIPRKTRHPDYICNNNTKNYYVVPDTEVCKYFYYCIFGIPFLAECPNNYEFSPIDLECLPAIVAGCNHTSTTTLSNQTATPTAPPRTTTSELSFTTFDLSTMTTEPTSTSNFISTGVPPSTIEVTRSTTEVPPKTTESPNRICNNTNDYHVIPDAKDCNRFYILCAHGNMIHQTCPIDHEFSLQFLKCLPAAVAGCNHTMTATSVSTVTPVTETSEVPEITSKASAIPTKYTFSPDIAITEVSPTTTEVPRATIVVPPSTRESPNRTCNGTKYFLSPDPNDCRHFYLCAYGNLIHVTCPLDYEFNPQILVCLPPSIAGCNHTTITTPTHTTTAPTVPNTNAVPSTTPVFASTTAEIPNTTFNIPSRGTEVTQSTRTLDNLCKNTTENYYMVPDPEDCKYFYICISGIPLHGKCVKNYEFSPTDLECLPVALAQCNYTTAKTFISSFTISIHTMTAASLLPDAIITEASPSTTRTVPIATEPSTYPKITTTEISPTSTDVSSTTTEPSDPICNNTHKYYYAPDPKNCRRFYICSYGNVDHETCPLNYEFNSQLMECLPTAIAECNHTTTNLYNKTTTSIAPLDSTTSKVSITITEVPTISTEATFLPNTKAADVPSSTIEVSSLTTGVPVLTIHLSSTTTQFSDDICNKTNMHYYVPDPKDCRRYYICTYGIMEYEMCPSNYEFSPLALICLPPSIAGCNHTRTTTNTVSTTTTPTISDNTTYVDNTKLQRTPTTLKFTPATTEVSKTSFGVPSTIPGVTIAPRRVNNLCKNKIGNYYVVPNPENCKYYYFCIFGIPVLAKCLENDEFSPIDLKCLPAATARCNHTTTKTITSNTIITPLLTTATPTLPDDDTTPRVPRVTNSLSTTTTEFIARPYVTTAEVSTTATDVLTTTSKILPPTIDVLTTSAKIPSVTIDVPATTSKIAPVTIEVPTITSKIPSVTIKSSTTASKIPPIAIDTPITTSKIPPVIIDIPIKTSKIPPVTTDAPRATSKRWKPINIDLPSTISKVQIVPTKSTDSLKTVTANLSKTTSVVPTATEIAKRSKPLNNLCKNVTDNYSIVPDTEDCKHFYICVFGIRVHGKCTKTGDYFNPIHLKCLPSETAGCNHTKSATSISTTSTTFATTTTLPHITTFEVPATTVEIPFETTDVPASTTKPSNRICNNLYKFYVLADPEDCKRFFLCIYGKVLHEKCPRDYEFNSLTLECLPTSIAGCSQTTVTKISHPSGLPSSIPPIINPSYVPHSTTDDLISTKVNPFSSTDSPHPNTEIPPSTTFLNLPTTTTVLPTPPNKCNYTNEQPVYYLPDKENCRQYYMCYYGDLYRETCPKDFEFNYIYMVCQPPHQAQCNSTRYSKSATASQQLDNCTQDTPVHYYPDIKDCNAYYICFHGISYRHRCPHQHSFDKDSLKCIPDVASSCNITEQ